MKANELVDLSGDTADESEIQNPPCLALARGATRPYCPKCGRKLAFDPFCRNPFCDIFELSEDPNRKTVD